MIYILLTSQFDYNTPEILFFFPSKIRMHQREDLVAGAAMTVEEKGHQIKY